MVSCTCSDSRPRKPLRMMLPPLCIAQWPQHAGARPRAVPRGALSMKTSALGIAFIEHHEGVVLRAYRDPVGVWTIGPGLTAASGVIKPKAGMVITPEESTRLTAEALTRSYEPEVAVAMTRKVGATFVAPKQNEFDAGVSFHWNTGAIRKASWVKAWTAPGRFSADIRAKLALWNKGGGKVLPGLVRRRTEEADILLQGSYPQAVRRPAPPQPTASFAAWGLPLSDAEKAAARDALIALGYKTTAGSFMIDRQAAEAFQRDHALTVDGILGRATLATLQRRLNARKTAVTAPTTSAALVAPAASPDVLPELTGLPLASAAIVALGLFILVRALVSNRDVVAVKIANKMPRIAAFLRSF